MTVLATAIALSFGAAALADSMTKPQHTSAKNEIEAAYKAAKVACERDEGQCEGHLHGRGQGQGESRACRPGSDLQAQHEGALRGTRRAGRCRYSVAKEKCDDLAGNAKDVCRKEADTAHIAGKADAKAQMKTVGSEHGRRKKTPREGEATNDRQANEKATKKIAEAHKDAAEDKREADYALAKEKCDCACRRRKDACLADAKARYGNRNPAGSTPIPARLVRAGSLLFARRSARIGRAASPGRYAATSRRCDRSSSAPTRWSSTAAISRPTTAPPRAACRTSCSPGSPKTRDPRRTYAHC
jgi:hypothetical protein